MPRALPPFFLLLLLTAFRSVWKLNGRFDMMKLYFLFQVVPCIFMDRIIDNNFIKGYFGSAAATKNEIYLDHQVLNYRVRLFCYFWYLHTHAVCFELCSVIYVSHCSNQWTCSLRNWYYCLYCVPNLCFYKHVRYSYKRGDSMICLLWMRIRLSWIFFSVYNYNIL